MPPLSLHHSIRPRRIQKWQRQPSVRRTDGSRLGRPNQSELTFQRGRRSGLSERRIGVPHPDGHGKVTHFGRSTGPTTTAWPETSSSGAGISSAVEMRNSGRSIIPSQASALAIELRNIILPSQEMAGHRRDRESDRYHRYGTAPSLPPVGNLRRD